MTTPCIRTHKTQNMYSLVRLAWAGAGDPCLSCDKPKKATIMGLYHKAACLASAEVSFSRAPAASKVCCDQLDAHDTKEAKTPGMQRVRQSQTQTLM